MGLDQRSYDEQHDFIRVPVGCEISLVKVAGGKRFLASGGNLSAGGVAFPSDEPLRPGERLQMHIEARQALVSVLDATIEVLRVEPDADGRSCTVGCANARRQNR